jgi:hypothetical protein
MARQRGPGRPREFRHRTKATIHLETRELRAVKQAAAEAGVSVAAWLRRAVLAALPDATGRTTG